MTMWELSEPSKGERGFALNRLAVAVVIAAFLTPGCERKANQREDSPDPAARESISPGESQTVLPARDTGHVSSDGGHSPDVTAGEEADARSADDPIADADVFVDDAGDRYEVTTDWNSPTAPAATAAGEVCFGHSRVARIPGDHRVVGSVIRSVLEMKSGALRPATEADCPQALEPVEDVDAWGQFPAGTRVDLEEVERSDDGPALEGFWIRLQGKTHRIVDVPRTPRDFSVEVKRSSSGLHVVRFRGNYGASNSLANGQEAFVVIDPAAGSRVVPVHLFWADDLQVSDVEGIRELTHVRLMDNDGSGALTMLAASRKSLREVTIWSGRIDAARLMDFPGLRALNVPEIENPGLLPKHPSLSELRTDGLNETDRAALEERFGDTTRRWSPPR